MNLKRLSGRWVAVLALGGVMAAPVGAESLGETFQRNLTGENVGKAVGAVAGALLGSQVGGGKGKYVGVAVGTLAGYWLGGEVGKRLSSRDQQGIASTTEQALETGQAQSWQNPNTGTYTRVSVADAPPPASARVSGKEPLARVPALELVNDFYVAEKNVNVRGGPGTDYRVLYGLKRDERVPVVGRVARSDWVMIAEDGEGSGFVYAPLLSPASRDGSGNALRLSMNEQASPRSPVSVEPRCSNITQEVVLRDGTRDTERFTACRQDDGRWVRL